MSDKPSDHLITQLTSVGATPDGQHIVVEFTDHHEAGQRVAIPFTAMSKLIIGLQAAMQQAIDTNAQRPGFHISDLGGAKVGLETYGVGHARAATQDPLVVLHLQARAKFVLDVMLPPEQARQLGSDLIAEADSLAEMSRPKPS